MSAGSANGMKIRRRVFSKGLLLILLGTLVVTAVIIIAWLTHHYGVKNSWLEPQPILTLAALALGFLLLNWQLDRQHRDSLEANIRQGQDRLRLDVYKEIAERIEATSYPLAELANTPTAFVGELIVRGETTRIASRYQSRLAPLHKEAGDPVMALMATLEIYEIALPGFAVFRQTLSDSHQRALTAYGDFLQVAYPIAGPQTDPMFGDDYNKEELHRLANVTHGAALGVMAAVADLRIAAQNYLLGGLFPDQRVPERVPQDPTFKVTKLSGTGK